MRAEQNDISREPFSSKPFRDRFKFYINIFYQDISWPVTQENIGVIP